MKKLSILLMVLCLSVNSNAGMSKNDSKVVSAGIFGAFVVATFTFLMSNDNKARVRDLEVEMAQFKASSVHTLMENETLRDRVEALLAPPKLADGMEKVVVPIDQGAVIPKNMKIELKKLMPKVKGGG